MKHAINEEIIRIKSIMGIITEARLEDVVIKYVGDGKPISEEKYREIQQVTKDDKNYIIWLVIRIVGGIIKDEDVYKYGEYFNIFNNHKRLFPIKDINQIKTIEDIENFIKKCVEIRERNITTDEFNKDNYVSVGDIQKLSEVGINYYGMVDGYQVFEVPNESKNNPESIKRYKEILGRCAGRDQGAKIDICTMGSSQYFEKYLKDYPDSSYFVMFNLSDRNSPYQFHYESTQFMDKNDNDITNRYTKNIINPKKIFDFIGEKNPKYSLDNMFSSKEIENSLQLNKNLHLIQYLDNPSEELQLFYIRRYPNNFEYIKNPSEQVQIEAIKNVRSPEEFITDEDEYQINSWFNIKSERIQFELIGKYGFLIRFIDNPSDKLQIMAVSGKHPESIQHIKNASEEVQLTAVRNNPTAIQYIENPSEEVQLTAIRDNPMVIQYIENPSEEAQLKVMEYGKFGIQYIKNPSERIQIESIKKYGVNQLFYIKNPSEEVQLVAIKQDRKALQYIKNPSKKIREYLRTGEKLNENISRIKKFINR